MSLQVLREKLLYAIHNCSAIDNDFSARGRVLLDDEDTEESFEVQDSDEMDHTVEQDDPFASSLSSDAEDMLGKRVCPCSLWGAFRCRLRRRASEGAEVR